MSGMKLTLQIQLLPGATDAKLLLDTVERFNQAANWLAGEAFKIRVANKIDLQRLFYRQLRERFALSAQMAVRCIAQVGEAYKRDKSTRPRFRKYAAVPYDQRLMSFKGVDRVSLLTLQGRRIVPVVMGLYQRERLTIPAGQSDLVRRHDGKWFLLVSVDLPDKTPIPATDFIGVDLGVVNLATTSDGETFQGGVVETVRTRYHTRRQNLQHAAARRKAKGRRPKNIRRALKRTRRRESNFRRHQNHCISKKLVGQAKDTGRGLALEELKNIRVRTRFRKAQRARMSGWSFHQLRQFIEYKSMLAGVTFVIVDPRDTSRTCSVCGHREKANRRSRSEFCCQSCHHLAQADINAALNIRAKALVSVPQVSEHPRARAV